MATTNSNSNSTNAQQATRRAVNKTKSVSHATTRRAKRAADTLDGKVSQLAETAGRRVSSIYNNGLHSAEDTAAHAREIVQEKPLAALAGAFLGGLLLATLMRR